MIIAVQNELFHLFHITQVIVGHMGPNKKKNQQNPTCGEMSKRFYSPVQTVRHLIHTATKAYLPDKA